MEARAISRYIHQSPRKIRIVLNEVRGQRVGDALNYLHFSPVKAAQIIEKTLRSAAANLIQIADEANVDPDELKVKEAFVDGGSYMKRFRPASRGRAMRITRPTSHLTIVVSDEKEDE